MNITVPVSLARSEATEILRSLVDTITVEFDQVGKSQISIQGSLAGILSLSQANKKAVSISQDDIQQIKLVAGAGFREASTEEVVVIKV